MIKLMYALLAFVATAAIAVGCGGDDDKKINIPGTDGDVTVSDDLPDDFPKSIPIYDDADFQGSISGETEGIEGSVATWTTGDSAEDVSAWYEDKLKDIDGWKVTSSGEFGGGGFWALENDDGTKAAYINVAGGDDTSILITVGDNPDGSSGDSDETPDDGSGSDEPTPDDGDDGGSSGGGDLPPEANLSDDFPEDRVPLPDGARVTSSSSFEGGGTKTFLVEVYSKDSIDDIASFYESEMPGNGWTNSFKSESDGVVSHVYSTEDESGSSTNGATITISESNVDGYNLVGITVMLSTE